MNHKITYNSFLPTCHRTFFSLRNFLTVPQSPLPDWNRLLFLFLFRLYIQTICQMTQEIAWDNIGICFNTSLSIQSSGYVTHLSEYIESVYSEQETVLEERSTDPDVPNQIVRIHDRFFITTACIHGQVRIDLPLVW